MSLPSFSSFLLLLIPPTPILTSFLSSFPPPSFVPHSFLPSPPSLPPHLPFSHSSFPSTLPSFLRPSFPRSSASASSAALAFVVFPHQSAMGRLGTELCRWGGRSPYRSSSYFGLVLPRRLYKVFRFTGMVYVYVFVIVFRFIRVSL